MDLQELSDRQEIVDLITRYTRAIDTRSYDALFALFTEDSLLDYSAVGGPVDAPVVVVPWIEAGLAGFDRFQHLVAQVAIEFGDDTALNGLGDTARACAYFTNPMVSTKADGSESLWEMGGYYHHDLVRTPRGWRSRRLVEELVWQRGF